MGAYGHHRIRHLVIGSTTAQMLRRCHIPILLFSYHSDFSRHVEKSEGVEPGV